MRPIWWWINDDFRLLAARAAIHRYVGKCLPIALAGVLLCACHLLKPQTQKPETQGELQSGYTYVPIDPLPVEPTFDRPSCKDPSSRTEVLNLLPDNAVRTLVEEINLSGTVSFGPSKIAAQDKTYRVTVDYINADTVNDEFWIGKYMRITGGGPDTQWVDLTTVPPANLVPGTEVYVVFTEKPDDTVVKDNNLVAVNIPLYVGIGLRITANVQAIGANANISGIGVIGAQADANLVRGTLVVQTLGVNGKSIGAALPIQSELNTTTAQNAVVAVGSIKALLYSPGTIISPRIVGLYLPFPGGQTLVNALVSAISKAGAEWHPECVAASASSETDKVSQADKGIAAHPSSAAPASAGPPKTPAAAVKPGSSAAVASPPPEKPKGAREVPKKDAAKPKPASDLNVPAPH